MIACICPTASFMTFVVWLGINSRKFWLKIPIMINKHSTFLTSLISDSDCSKFGYKYFLVYKNCFLVSIFVDHNQQYQWTICCMVIISQRGGVAVYRVVLKQPSGISLVVNHRTADVQVMLDRTVTLVLVPVEPSTSISGSYAATYVVNSYVPQIYVYLH